MIVDKIRGSKLYQEKLSHTKLVAVLKKGKKTMGKCKNKIRVILKLQERYPRLLPILQQNLYAAREEAGIEEIYEKMQGQRAVDVIVPIYNGYDFLARLFEDLPKAGMPCNFILVDDKSPDERVHKLEEQFVQNNENAILLKNEENLGFVCSVNRGLEQAKGHVALVNTDTELPKGWLARLMYPIVFGDKVGTTTPYSNSATIFSFPNFCYNNAIYRNLDVDTLDSYFQQAKCRYLQGPTGVGFCMGMNKQAIEEVGILDAEAYGRGYGEENDWCQRAVKAGYSNVQVENLFVYHKHGGSFISEEKQKLIDDHMRILRRNHPNYEAQVSEYIRKDGNGALRRALEMVIDTHETTSVLYFNHSLGGGATSYLNQKKDKIIKDGGCVTVVFFDPQIQSWNLFFENNRGVQKYENHSMEELLEVCSFLKFDKIIINELVLFPYLWEMQKTILKIKENQKNAELIMLCHDLFAICPSINLVDESMSYCGMPGKEACDKCFLEKRFVKDFQCENRAEWNANWKIFLEQFSEVRAFSQDTLNRMKAVYGDELKYTLVPHEVNYAFPIQKETKTTKTLNIGLLGVLTIHKGGMLVNSLLDYIERENLPIRIKLIGKTEKISLSGHSAFSQTGAYNVEDLPGLIYENDIDLFFISSVWPETFSYTAEEVMKMGMPVAALDIGAPADRVEQYEKGLVIKAPQGENVTKLPAEEIVTKLSDFAKELGLMNRDCFDKKILYVAEDRSFTTRYRVEHLRDELLYQGITGDLVITHELKANQPLDNYCAVVIYRCKYQGKVPEFLAEVKRQGIPLLCDMDDYIFDYSAIKELPFLQDEEYKDFESYSLSLRKTMEQCDKFIASTDHMKLAIEKTFPGKPVFVNRNMASTQMLILSAKAKQMRALKDKFILGYYSGSHTHNRDFELISQVLLDFLKSHKDAYLKLVGCLELPKSFDCVADKIYREGFMDWKELPASISQIDWNLMPLENTFFHRCKSENKWMEAALVGVPTMASYNEELQGVTKDGENIVLCHSKEEWSEKLNLAYQDKKYGMQIGEAAYAYAMGHKTTLCKNPALRKFVLGEEGEDFPFFYYEDSDPEKLVREIREATSDYCLILDREVKLSKGAVKKLSAYAAEHPGDVYYADEIRDKKAYYKPDWSPDLFAQLPYMGKAVGYRLEALKRCLPEEGSFRNCAKWNWQAVKNLLSSEKDCKIVHMPEILYEDETPWETEEVPAEYPMEENALLSIIIPSKDHSELLFTCLKSVEETIPNKEAYEILVVDNGSCEEEKNKIMEHIQGKPITYLYQPMEFNFAAMCNMGAKQAKGRYLMFLNDDVELEGDWFYKVTGQAQQAHTGAVGVKLYYPDSRKIQHAGVALLGKNPCHVMCGMEDEGDIYFGRNRLAYNYLAVTAACMTVSADKFRQVGGFDEGFRVSYNDVDLCMKLYEAGYYNVARNDICFTHYESASRGLDAIDEAKNSRMVEERERLLEKHSIYKQTGDPFYNPNLSEIYADFREKAPEEKPDYAVPQGELAKPWKYEAAFMGYIDSVDIDRDVLVKGWSFFKSDDWMAKARVYLAVEDNKGLCRTYATTAYNREDVAQKLGFSTVNCGFVGKIRRDDFEKESEYRFGVLLKGPGKMLLTWAEGRYTF